MNSSSTASQQTVTATVATLADAVKRIDRFYRRYLPMVPKMRGDRVSPFWIRMSWKR